MKPLIAKIKPASGFSHFVHLALLAILPALVFILVRLNFVQLALSIVILSKWRMLAVKPRFWPAILRANSIDIMVGLSIVIFMASTDAQLWQLLWAAVYAVWLIRIKPASSTLMIAAQAVLGQLAGLTALFTAWHGAPLYGLVLGAGIVCYLGAHHFFDNFDESYAHLLSSLWGYFGAAITWVLGHWLLFYGVIAQPTLLISTIGYGLAVLYYFDHTDKLTANLKRQIIFVMLAIVLVVLTFSDWGDKVV